MSESQTFVFDPARLFRAMEKIGHSHALGLQYVQHGDDWAEIIMPWRPDLVGDVDRQTMATGAISGLIDMACGVSVWTRLDTFRPQATLDLRIDYMRAAAPQTAMVARAECYRITREISFVRGFAHDGDITDPVAAFSASFMFTGPAVWPSGQDRIDQHLGPQS